MNAYHQLGLLAEVAAAFLGFIAIFIMFSRDDGRFAESDKHFVQGLVVTATSVIILCLLPRVLSLFFPEAAVWEICVFVVVVLGPIIAAYQAWDQFIMPHEEAIKVHWGWHVPGWTLTVFSFLFLIAAALGLLAADGGYMVAMTLLLSVTLWCFIAIVFRKFF